MTQNEQIIQHLHDYGSITPLDAMQEYGIMRLAARINDLKRDGYHIITETESRKNRFGKKVSYSRYRKAD